ncbi:MAG: NUDIX domain-containing protein [Bacteroidales bacterium]|nr:NUDIX domain-containing protein [Bacteroidales bacterium]
MYRIYFNKRCLAVCSINHKALNEPDAVLYSPGAVPELADLPKIFDESPQITKLYVPSHNQENTFKQLCTKFSRITAGGGIVTNKKGEYLIIFHHGVWDFPKGMQESGEDIRQTAMREVEEECGIHDLEIHEHLCDTYHTYHRDGEFILKTTRWYRMNYLGNGTDTHPQAEEEIERAIWAPPTDLPTYFANTYPSIQYLYKLVTQEEK